jgi:predicted transglutaminase-like cysteine proteinase
MKTVVQCRSDRARCPSPAALRFLSIVDSAAGKEGLARFGEINRSINQAIRLMSDLKQYHLEDFRSSPLAKLVSGAGDCVYYAIAKFAALRRRVSLQTIYGSSSCATLYQEAIMPSLRRALTAVGACSTTDIS